MAFGVSRKITGKSVRTAMIQQGHSKDYVNYYIINGVYIMVAFLGQFQIFLNWLIK